MLAKVVSCLLKGVNCYSVIKSPVFISRDRPRNIKGKSFEYCISAAALLNLTPAQRCNVKLALGREAEQGRRSSEEE